MSKKATSYIPNIITLCNLLSGCVALFFAFHIGDVYGSLTGLHLCWIAMATAAVFDFCDGASARALKAYSPLGAELDSLSDLVSFGVAPAMMMLNIMDANGAGLAKMLSMLIIALAGAMRLAKFNTDSEQTTTFKGLPIPANAIFWIGFAAWIERYVYPGDVPVIALAVLMSWLMVSNVKMFSLKFHNFDIRENFRRYVLILATIAFLINWGVAGLVWAIALYIFISLLGRKET